jgi:hypothetical protein
MSLHNEPDYKTLEKNLIEIIQEQQIKIGYRNEIIRLYYPMESINNLLNINTDVAQLPEVLRTFCSFVTPRLGEVSFTNKDTRFCFVIPEKGVNYAHESIEDRKFLRDFIGRISEHDCTLEDILEIFYCYSSKVKCEKKEHNEFDYLIYFEDGQPDSFLYCIKFEDHHAIYHRFTKADYLNFEF